MCQSQERDWKYTLMQTGARVFRRLVHCITMMVHFLRGTRGYSGSVCHSTAEAEYISASSAAREGIFHREAALDCGDLPAGPSVLLLDSKSAIDMCFDPCQFKKTKHILRDAYFLRDVVARELFKPVHVSSENEVADIMSKAVSRPIFLQLRPQLVQSVS